ncbi:methylated-DNA--[protein]-cysteine S-methyltransferase [Paenibacillus chondroitinus]|uniref:Methylated-DNA--protein-cysteine methyltransferase n=1 Tax=Paenibacillus chondroitinus TaxID=59842 RepID=A0ABU6DH14_9BACL|nr:MULTISPECIES: methylated-DNA--[protein]-cysteine S-methyltransferase [Paenibacillus]MEB4796959.1 methylated-DNA--[protein]-cysteine S-methyltransferase [Paenibacillus chondroitinus]
MTYNQQSAANKLIYTEVATPIGALVLITSPKGLCRVAFGTMSQNQDDLQEWVTRWFGKGTEFREDVGTLAPIVQQLEEYFRGERLRFDGELDLQGTDFQKKVWTALLDVPYGETASYKHIAEAIQSPKAVRAVGGANNKNPIPVIIPCHRIIGVSGGLVGYAGGLDMKIHLLDLEREERPHMNPKNN